MELWPSPLPSWIVLIIVLAIGAVFVTKQVGTSKGSKYKSKTILKELLETYGLEIPTELEDVKKPITLPIKKN